MKTLKMTLPVKYKFFGFGDIEPIESQPFDTKLEEFRQKAYTGAPNVRARRLIDDAINSIKTLLGDIWNAPDKLRVVRMAGRTDLKAYVLLSNGYTAYSVTLFYGDGIPPRSEAYETRNFEKAIQAEKNEMFKKYGFTVIPPKKYRVTFERHEAVLDEHQLSELRKKHPEFCFAVSEVCD